MSPRLVRDAEGTRLRVIERSRESTLVVDPATGERRHVPNDELEVLDEETPLSTALESVPDDVRTLLTAVHDERALGVLLDLELTGPTAVRQLTTTYTLCESDLHGLLAELRAAGLIAETEVYGERGYETTAVAGSALEQIRGEAN